MAPKMTAIDARQLERAVERARSRIESIAETVSNETVGEILEDLRHEAAPIAARAVPILERAAERATGRRRKSRKPKIALIAAGVVAVAGLVAYILWQRRDEEPAYLTQTPDRPDLTPAQTPPSAPEAPSSGPSAPEPLSDMGGSSPDIAPVMPPDPPAPATPAREYSGAPHAIFGLGDRDEFDERRAEGNRLEGNGLPVTPRANFAPAPVQLPSSPRRSWLPR
ncbi:MAG: hypothetical protein AB7G21_05135 [Dehalococcoidia bacterium]